MVCLEEVKCESPMLELVGYLMQSRASAAVGCRSQPVSVRALASYCCFIINMVSRCIFVPRHPGVLTLDLSSCCILAGSYLESSGL